MARFGTPKKGETDVVAPAAPVERVEAPSVPEKREARAQAKLEELWDGIEEAARVEREAIAQWEREGKKGEMPVTPAVERMMQIHRRGKPRWGRE